ncbi:glycoside hydrolase family 95 protein [Coraliomargarita sinensis]|nr:glycoside hydrolase family 95 protein [Coraliomargarita sinensis]
MNRTLARMSFVSCAGLIFVLCGCHSLTGSFQKAQSEKTYELWERQPAPNRGHDFEIEKPGRGYPFDPDWERWSYPLGNGMLGANVFGRTDVERIQLSEKTFANGSAYGRGGATNATELYLDIGHENVTNYRRALNLNDAIHTVSYQSGGVGYQREYFTSYPDDVMVVRLTADEAKALSLTVRPEIPYLDARNELDSKSGSVTADGDLITLTGTIDYYQVNFEIQVKVLPEGGRLLTGESSIQIEEADAVTLLVAVDTNYILGPHIFLNDPKDKLDPEIDPHAWVAEKIEKATALGFDALKARHLKDYRDLFGRVAVNLNSQVSELPTHGLLEAYRNGAHNPYLEELLFQYGRYLLIASSRETTLPAHLQGAWTQYEVSPWCAGYWHNINVQMNYWGAFSTNLAETFDAYLNYFEAYKPQARRFAREFIEEIKPGELSDDPADNGWILGTGANAYQISGRSTHSGPGTGAFTSQLLMDHYDFTQDETYLREVGYPSLLEMSKFFDKALHETEDGVLLIKPSASPEIKLENGEYYVTEGCTFDQGFVWENHNNVLRAAEALGRDDPFLDVIRRQIPRLDPIQVGSSGQIKEFREENTYGEIGDPHHRHISHLCTLYPGTLIDTSKPEWMEAAATTLNLRGDLTTGWAMAHRMICWARLKSGERALELYRKFIVNKLGENLWSLHPPFQIDGNFGCMAGVAEMLLQSHEGHIDVIPALPEAWENGSFDGLVARGNFEVSAAWEAGRLSQLSVVSRSGKDCRIKYSGLGDASVFDAKGRSIEIMKEGKDEVSFQTEKGLTYHFRIK